MIFKKRTVKTFKIFEGPRALTFRYPTRAERAAYTASNGEQLCVGALLPVLYVPTREELREHAYIDLLQMLQSFETRDPDLWHEIVMAVAEEIGLP